MNLMMIFLLFLYFGILCFGGGSSLTPLYIDELISSRHWMTLDEFGNFSAISQMTPGPIGVNVATFIGYKQGGIAGAVIATAGLLLPSYFLVIFAIESLKKWENSRLVQGMMTGIRPATIGMISASLLIYMGMSVFNKQIPWMEIAQFLTGGNPVWPENFRFSIPAFVIFVLSTVLLYKNKAGIIAIIFGSALLGAVFCR